MRTSHVQRLAAVALAGLALCAGDAPAQQPGAAATRAAAAQAVNPKDRPAVERLFRSWNLPVPPRHLIGNVYYVGASGVSSFLVTTPDGHVLIDTGFEQTVPLVVKGIAQLGFRVEDVRFILSSHAHADHVGGHARMKQLTGAKVVASEADARVMASGGADDFSPFPKDLMRYAPVNADRIVRDGDTVSLGGVTLTARLTPGHTKGATTWTMRVADETANRPLDVVFFSSVTIVEGTRLVGNNDYPTIVEDYRATFRTLKSLPCDVFFAPHGGQFAMYGKFARLDRGERPNPLIDPDGYRKAIADAESAFLAQLEREQKAR